MLEITASYLPDCKPSGQSGHATGTSTSFRPSPSAISLAMSGSTPTICLLSAP